ncbi:S-adenosyl-L-methionine-dependent methyltransferase [Sistotremastrum niveocremeum HHB9708]|uniref:S-adenosyl-L-methionine-dependent methyltransferase n=1 Tax=Sistotremastrum niveocremeum HHB9708 TaxID=1314777 RepID=A0A164W3B6_9AGAM|nr:S-adenosyl-L-methionine-dependent methyltransferase [Sistotremastrum niveocremeum HHB9708]
MAPALVMESTGTLRDSHGRGMNVMSEEYIFPADLPEIDRLNLQHNLWKRAMKGNCSVPADELDAVFAKQKEPAILDLGRGTGIWCKEMAEAYPEARVVGVDLVDSVPAFIKGDITQGLSSFRNQFDLVHVRLVIVHIKGDAAKEAAIGQAIACLRPGGIIVISTYDESYASSSKQFLSPARDDEDNSNRSWCTRYLAEAFGRSGECVVGDFTQKCLVNDAAIDKKSIRSDSYYIPVGWDGGDGTYGGVTGEMSLRQTYALFETCKPSLISKGVPQKTIDEWERKAEEEIKDPRKRLFHVVRSIWGRKL